MSPAKAQPAKDQSARPAPEAVSLAEFNGMPAPDARRLLLACCPAERWAGQVAAGRPFGSVGDALLRSDAAVAGLTKAGLRQALAGHRRIGAQAHPEQAGVDHGDQELIRALAEGNRAYERRFGHIYLVCATGRSGRELLALLQQRLGHEPAAEWRVLAAELAKINRIRLARQLRESG